VATRVRLLLPVAALTLVAGCASFADAPAGTASSLGTATTTPTATSTTADGPLAVTDEVDLGRSAADVTGARVAADRDGYAVLLQGGAGGTVLTPDGATGVTGTVLTDVALVDGDPVAAALTAGAVDPDPAVGVLLAAGSTALPTDLAPAVAAPRGLPVLAATGGDQLFLLAETPDGVGAQVLAVDPATAEVLATADLDLDVDGATAVELVGLVPAGDGGVVAGLGVTTPDEDVVARLVELDADLEPVGRASGPEGRLVGLTGDAGTARALVEAPDGTLRLFGPQGGRERGDLGAGSRVAGVAAYSSGAGTVVVTAFLDQPRPTVVVTAPDGDPTTLELCDGDGDALAVAAAGDGTFLVAGTCDGDSRLWTLG
jgi:hypothetical protein